MVSVKRNHCKGEISTLDSVQVHNLGEEGNVGLYIKYQTEETCRSHIKKKSLYKCACMYACVHMNIYIQTRK